MGLAFYPNAETISPPPRADPAVRTSRHRCFPPRMTLDGDTEQAGSCVPGTKATPAPSAHGRLPQELLACPGEALLVTAQAGTQGGWGRGRGVAGELQLQRPLRTERAHGPEGLAAPCSARPAHKGAAVPGTQVCMDQALGSDVGMRDTKLWVQERVKGEAG